MVARAKFWSGEISQINGETFISTPIDTGLRPGQHGKDAKTDAILIRRVEWMFEPERVVANWASTGGSLLFGVIQGEAAPSGDQFIRNKEVVCNLGITSRGTVPLFSPCLYTWEAPKEGWLVTKKRLHVFLHGVNISATNESSYRIYYSKTLLTAFEAAQYGV